MTDVKEVAAAILNTKQYLTTMKLQKLVYYSQVYSLVKYDKPIFNDDFIAGPLGPIVYDLYALHKGMFLLEVGFFGDTQLSDITDKDTLDSITHSIDNLGDMTGRQITELACSEDPIIECREGLDTFDFRGGVITKQRIKEYYSSTSHQLFIDK